ncbi:MAG: CRISPR-associated endonuclease Cas2 [Candidatus Taylorbacteria bacterium RIFCSPHIGHO2_02_FULL_46_13]|uniref:CRISPR-associated endonuclease Cas2 n=1 Tax=Candidatus Taylorbacteria bacterium RIFCSPHIGHO2_02_FULL_46_13 TaxID=1802312 RepID=A0A1G2MU16_9BACT|nr:MAG: CRISPR-associated endonuclease Cas2 [Candidatus Taylorbacteria bacterium RIFCSPHIGHO2_02_FULL_46_13]
MGKLEQQVKIRMRNSKITRAILTTLAVAVAGALNPGGLVRGVLREVGKKKGGHVSSKNSIYIARGRLLKQGLIEYHSGFFRATEKGKQLLRTSEGEYKPIPYPRKWDKKWRILIFDIREERKTLREKVRRTLVAIGFRRLQDSVWVCPYDCEDFVALLKADFKIGKDLLYIIADEIENDTFLRKEFQLE